MTVGDDNVIKSPRLPLPNHLFFSRHLERIILQRNIAYDGLKLNILVHIVVNQALLEVDEEDLSRDVGVLPLLSDVWPPSLVERRLCETIFIRVVR